MIVGPVRGYTYDRHIQDRRETQLAPPEFDWHTWCTTCAQWQTLTRWSFSAWTNIFVAIAITMMRTTVHCPREERTRAENHVTRTKSEVLWQETLPYQTAGRIPSGLFALWSPRVRTSLHVSAKEDGFIETDAEKCADIAVGEANAEAQLTCALKCCSQPMNRHCWLRISEPSTSEIVSLTLCALLPNSLIRRIAWGDFLKRQHFSLPKLIKAIWISPFLCRRQLTTFLVTSCFIMFANRRNELAWVNAHKRSRNLWYHDTTGQMTAH